MATKRVCSWPGCPLIVSPGGLTGNFCATHKTEWARKADERRGSRQERGYGREHEAEREKWKKIMRRKMVRCWRCLQPINPALPWDLGHVPGTKQQWAGPEHVRCSRSAH